MNRILKLIFPVLMIALGVAAIIGGADKLKNKHMYDSSTSAVITGIEREWTGTDSDGFDEYEYHVYVEYEVGGKTYKDIEYPGYNGSMEKGDEIEILYQSSAPEKISETNITGNSLIFIIGGAVLAIVGVVAEIRAIIKR